MAKRIFSNGGVSYLSTAALSGDTTLVLQDGSSFPTPGTGEQYTIRVGSEYCLVTGKSSNTLTVTRGQQSSTAAAQPLGSVVFVCLTAQDLIRIMRVSKDGTVAGERRETNFIVSTGNGIGVLLTDDPTNEKVDVQLSLTIEVVGTAPTAAPTSGQSNMRYCSADNKLYAYNGSAWKSAAFT